MDPKKYELISLGSYMGKYSYLAFFSVLLACLIGLIVGSTYSDDMYVYRDNGYHYCIHNVGVTQEQEANGLIPDSIAKTEEQDFFFTPVQCAQF